MITSLHSPHVEAVKALLGSRGNKERRQSSRYVIEGAQNINSALSSVPDLVEKIYFTADNREKINSPSWTGELIEVAPNVMKAMSDTVTPQGLIAVAKMSDLQISDFKDNGIESESISCPDDCTCVTGILYLPKVCNFRIFRLVIFKI